jgi:hypothetical protein
VIVPPDEALARRVWLGLGQDAPGFLLVEIAIAHCGLRHSAVPNATATAVCDVTVSVGHSQATLGAPRLLGPVIASRALSPDAAPGPAADAARARSGCCAELHRALHIDRDDVLVGLSRRPIRHRARPRGAAPRPATPPRRAR